MDLPAQPYHHEFASSTMFNILGPDGKQDGPLSAETLRQWIGQRKVDARTPVQEQGSSEWKTLGDLPELADALSSRPPKPPPLPGAGPPRLPLPSSRRTSGLAIAAFALSLLTFCTLGLSSLAGCVVGYLAVRQINRSQGQLRGKGLAVTGLVLSTLFLLIMLAGLAVVLPQIARQRQHAATVECVEHLKQVALAVRTHAEKHESKFPPAADWCEAILPLLESDALLRCPRRDHLRSGYAYNRNIAGRTTSSVPPDVVLLIESDRGWNASATQEDPVARSAHGRTYCVAFADGSVREVDANELSSLRWEP